MGLAKRSLQDLHLPTQTWNCKSLSPFNFTYTKNKICTYYTFPCVLQDWFFALAKTRGCYVSVFCSENSHAMCESPWHQSEFINLRKTFARQFIIFIVNFHGKVPLAKTDFRPHYMIIFLFETKHLLLLLFSMRVGRVEMTRSVLPWHILTQQILYSLKVVRIFSFCFITRQWTVLWNRMRDSSFLKVKKVIGCVTFNHIKIFFKEYFVLRDVVYFVKNNYYYGQRFHLQVNEQNNLCVQ